MAHLNAATKARRGEINTSHSSRNQTPISGKLHWHTLLPVRSRCSVQAAVDRLGIECLPGEYSQRLREQGVPTTAWLMKKYKRAWLKPTCRSCDSCSRCACGAVCVLLPVDPTCASVAVCTSLTTRVLFAAAKSWLFSHSLPVKALCSAQGR